MKSTANYINHIALVLDASSSMLEDGKDVELIKVSDALIKHLAKKSTEMDQETRVSVYTFSYSTRIKCVIFDKDVLRLPSIKDYYQASGMTALIDATLKSQDDLAQTAQMYGDHAFLTYVLTDGGENDSTYSMYDLNKRLTELPDNWTVACLVPTKRGVALAKRQGFPVENIEIWDATSAEGVSAAADRIRETADTFMSLRASGVRGTKSLFSTSIGDVNKTTIKSANLKALPKNKYDLLDVDDAAPIREWVQAKQGVFLIGSAYYQLSKRETIQPQKNIAVMDKKNGKIYAGDQARNLLGLPQNEVRVSPDYNPDYDVFVQSTSVNRKLVPGTKLLVLK